MVRHTFILGKNETRPSGLFKENIMNKYEQDEETMNEFYKELSESMCMPFDDQRIFMEACDQTTVDYNEKQYKMYLDLIKEEYEELFAAYHLKDKVEQLDALIDIIVVTVGAIHSLGANAEGAWNEVMRTNFAKIDEETGKVRKRDDGKVLKPEGWQPPQLANYVEK